MGKLNERPNRRNHDAQSRELLALDETKPPISEPPDRLSIDDIHIASALFQPREVSLLLAPFKSDQHVKTLAAAIKRGSDLEPVAVVSFGDKWFLVDGHHRLQAYLKAKHEDPVPVAAYSSASRGNERLIWAQTLSTELDSRDKLPMSPADKMDAAWRLCVEGGQTKEQIANVAGCSTSAVGNMRRAAKQLRQDGRFQDSDLVAFSWRRAYNEAVRRDGEEPARAPTDRELRVLIKKLAPVVNSAFGASLVIRALEELQPGYSAALKEAIEDMEAISALGI